MQVAKPCPVVPPMVVSYFYASSIGWNAVVSRSVDTSQTWSNSFFRSWLDYCPVYWQSLFSWRVCTIWLFVVVLWKKPPMASHQFHCWTKWLHRKYLSPLPRNRLAPRFSLNKAKKRRSAPTRNKHRDLSLVEILRLPCQRWATGTLPPLWPMVCRATVRQIQANCVCFNMSTIRASANAPSTSQSIYAGVQTSLPCTCYMFVEKLNQYVKWSCLYFFESVCLYSIVFVSACLCTRSPLFVENNKNIAYHSFEKSKLINLAVVNVTESLQSWTEKSNLVCYSTEQQTMPSQLKPRYTSISCETDEWVRSALRWLTR